MAPLNQRCFLIADLISVYYAGDYSTVFRLVLLLVASNTSLE